MVMMRRIVEGTSRIISCDGSSILRGVVNYQIIIKCIPLTLPNANAFDNINFNEVY